MITFLGMLGFAFLGGVILNVMPCVLPVLTLKVFKTIQTMGEAPKEAKVQSVAYTAGTLLFFLIMAILVLAIRASGEALGWGMHFRHPGFVATLSALIFAFGLNALGVFEIYVSGNPDEKDGILGGVFTGMFAAVMSTPCSAPFLGGAASFALAANTPGWQTLALFLMIGFGLAFPFLLLGFIPGVAKIIPKPGAWMNTFKHLMGFTLIGAALWLFSVLLAQVTVDAAVSFLIFLFTLSVSLWSVGQFAALHHSAKRRWLVRALALGLSLGAMANVTLEKKGAVANESVGDAIVVDGHINWTPFAPERIAAENKAERLVFLDYTADWCANCKTNEKLFLETETVRRALQDNDVLPMKIDMTNENEQMDAWLSKVGRSAIPAYAIVFPDGSFDVLPVAITADLVAGRLAAAKGKKTAPK